jgi:hypothetical protein
MAVSALEQTEDANGVLITVKTAKGKLTTHGQPAHHCIVLYCCEKRVKIVDKANDTPIRET